MMSAMCGINLPVEPLPGRYLYLNIKIQVCALKFSARMDAANRQCL
jgi:hypothetical protein